MKTRTQIPLSDAELLVRAVRTCINTDRPLWAVVAERFAVGSGIARQLCRRFDLDPDEIRCSEQAPTDEDGDVMMDDEKVRETYRGMNDAQLKELWTALSADREDARARGAQAEDAAKREEARARAAQATVAFCDHRLALVAKEHARRHEGPPTC